MTRLRRRSLNFLWMTSCHLIIKSQSETKQREQHFKISDIHDLISKWKIFRNVSRLTITSRISFIYNVSLLSEYVIEVKKSSEPF